MLLDRILRTLGTGSAFLLFFFYGSFQAWVVLPLARLFATLRGVPLAEKNRMCRRIVGRSWVFFHDYMRWLHLIDYNPREVGTKLPDGPFVMVANHPTLIDVTALVSFHSDISIVAKTTMFNSRLLGPLLRSCDHIDGGDGGLFSGATVMTQGLARLAAGISVVIFPEGTRSPERGLGTFRQGAYEMAVRAGVPLVEAVITCDPPTLMRGQAWYEIPPRTSRLRVSVMSVLTPPYSLAPKDLMQDAQRRYRSHLEAIGQIDPPAAREPTTPAHQQVA